VAENFTGPRIVVAGSGVEHSELVSLAQDMLAGVPAGPPAPKMPSKYLGGDFRQFSASPQTTVMLGFEFAGGWKDVKVIAPLSSSSRDTHTETHTQTQTHTRTHTHARTRTHKYA
jgi:hypothetical protein